MIQISMPMSTLDIVIRLSCAAVFGAVIGFERDVHGRSAGLRTHLLVCLGSALFMLVSLAVSTLGEGGPHRVDPGRIAAQVVTGIGFLGAGVVIKQGVTVRGLTTAACLWVTAALGMAAGGGMYWVATFVTLLTLTTLVGLNFFERAFRRDSYRQAVIRTRLDVDVTRMLAAVRAAGVSVLACDTDRNYQTEVLTARIDIRIFHRGTTEPIAQRVLEAIQGEGIPIDRFSWRR
jgi:putative Mg2+ transporter-C (MgtC) family protein